MSDVRKYNREIEIITSAILELLLDKCILSKWIFYRTYCTSSPFDTSIFLHFQFIICTTYSVFVNNSMSSV